MKNWKMLVRSNQSTKREKRPKQNIARGNFARNKTVEEFDVNNNNTIAGVVDDHLPVTVLVSEKGLVESSEEDDVGYQRTVNNVYIDDTDSQRLEIERKKSPETNLKQPDFEGRRHDGRETIKQSLNKFDDTMLQLQQTSVKNLSTNMHKAPIKALPQEPPPCDEYSYAAVEHRPMSVTIDGAVTTPVNDKTRNSTKAPSKGLYSYAPVEIRPLAVGINSGVSIPIPDDKPAETAENNETISVNGQLEYNPVNQQTVSQTTDFGDLYAVVEKPPKTPSLNKPTPNPKSTLVESMSLYDSVADPVNNNKPDINIEDLYAPVDFSQKRRTSEQLPSNNLIYPTGFNSEHRRVSDGMLNTPYFPGASNPRKPPPMPKPYRINDQRSQLATHPEERLNSLQRSSVSSEAVFSTYSEVTIDQKNQNKVNTQSINNSTTADRLTKSQNTEQLSDLKNFQKHRRMRSHENVSILRSLNSSSGHSSAGSTTTLSDRSLNHASRTDSSSSMSNKSVEDDVFVSKNGGIYGNESMADIIRKANEAVTDELPEGWQEVQDGAETYFWHIWTGTIQHERPSLTATPTSSSRSVSPFSGLDSAASSRTPSVSDAFDPPKIASPRPETPDKVKQIISFPVHSMGWMDVDESLMGQAVISETVNNCVSTLAKERKDLFNTAETWAEGEDLKLILEGEILKLVDPKTKHVYHVQPIAKMRVWGVGREGEEKRDFAYIARDPTTKKHRCHMFRCHGQVSGRSVTNALQAICTRVLDEKRKAKERNENPAHRKSSDLLRPPSKASSNFNEKPYTEEKKRFTAKYVGSSEVSKPSGIDVVNKVVARLTGGETNADWSSVLLEVTMSEIKTIDCVKQQVTMEHRVRFISFLAVAEDERFGAYIVAVAENQFTCHVFFCAPHAGTLTKAIQEACKMRFEKTLDSQSIKKDSQEATRQQQAPTTNSTAAISGGFQRGSMKEKTKMLTSSIAGVFKFNRKDVRKKEEESPNNSRPSSFNPAPNEHVIKYFGAMPVEIGTGLETVEHAAKNLAHGEMMLGYLEVGNDCLTISDAQRSPVSQRIFDVSNISYCGMTGDRKSFGVVISRGKGKFICHIFQEYKANTGVEIVDAIQGVL